MVEPVARTSVWLRQLIETLNRHQLIEQVLIHEDNKSTSAMSENSAS